MSGDKPIRRSAGMRKYILRLIPGLSVLFIFIFSSCSGPAGRDEALQKQHFLCDSFFERGQHFYDTNRYDSALYFYDKSHQLALETEDLGRQARSLERQASVHLATDDPGLALRQYLESLVLFEKVSDSSGMAKAYNILGVYYTELNGA